MIRSNGTAETRPTYAAAFRCIGASCEDPCCREWEIPVDRVTYEKYRQFPEERLGSLVSAFVSINAAGSPDSLYAQINPTPTGACPFFGADRLCGIQKEYGPGLLSTTCSIYPRALNQVDGVLEGSLSLSCPEAARQVLLAPDSTEAVGNLLAGDFRTDNFFRLANSEGGSIHKPDAWFHALRALLIATVRDRSRPMWERLLLIGSLCERLDTIRSAEEDGSVPVILADYREMLANRLHAELESMPSRPGLKLEVILALTNERLQDGACGSRFHDTFWAFVEGIGSPMDSAAGDDIERYLEAERLYHRPFFERSPFVLENYLVNYIYQNLFPFGREGSSSFTPQSIFDEYILMATQFAWINGLLIGVAGSYREDFDEAQVVRVVQSFSRAVEHYPHVLRSINELMRARRLDSLEGMAIMLKD